MGKTNQTEQEKQMEQVNHTNRTNQTERIKEILCNRTPGRIDGELYRDAAILVPIVEQDGELNILFEVRADRLRTQPGEVCFPGGSMEPPESPVEAALRETSEELLTKQSRIEVIAPLDVLLVPAGLTVHPFLGALHGYEGTFSEAEVARICLIPLAWFLEHEPQVFETKVLTVPAEDFPYSLVPEGKDYKWRQGRYQVLFYQYDGLVIWGMTAKILRSFIELYRREVLPLQTGGSDRKRTP